MSCQAQRRDTGGCCYRRDGDDDLSGKPASLGVRMLRSTPNDWLRRMAASTKAEFESAPAEEPTG